MYILYRTFVFTQIKWEIHTRANTIMQSKMKLKYTAAYCFSYVAALLPSMLSAGSILGGLMVGIILDTPSLQSSIPRANFVLVAGLVASAVFNAPLPYAGSLTEMSFLTIFLGVANGFFRASANTMILRVHGVNNCRCMDRSKIAVDHHRLVRFFYGFHVFHQF